MAIVSGGVRSADKTPSWTGDDLETDRSEDYRKLIGGSCRDFCNDVICKDLLKMADDQRVEPGLPARDRRETSIPDCRTQADQAARAPGPRQGAATSLWCEAVVDFSDARPLG